MSDDQLLRLLRTIGFKAYVENIDLLELSSGTAQIAEKLSLRNKWTLSGSRTRVNAAKRIHQAEAKKRALTIIVNAQNISEETAQKAAALLKA
ncbi:hypothetical protein [Celeribacter sp. SCSIO 80788]|uniref:hypothetical protein n=1 Tax=Celeribacter sp. SCSIO 80788 TaxID=3117013 RepID=UPI003DA48E5A